MPFCRLVTVVMALPSEAFGARLKDTVMAGNCPWRVIESGSVMVSKCENALSGMALLGVPLVAPAEFPPVRMRVAGASVFAAGVYSAPTVSAFDPAEVEPLPDEVDAPAPEVPVAPFAWT